MNSLLYHSAILRETAQSDIKLTVSYTAPILEDPGVVEYSNYDLELYFNQPSPYRGPPTPEREALWEYLWHSKYKAQIYAKFSVENADMSN